MGVELLMGATMELKEDAMTKPKLQESTKTVDEIYDATKKRPHKTMTIDMTYKTPKITIDGPWTGHDIIACQGNIRRAYHLRQRQLRREKDAINQEEA